MSMTQILAIDDSTIDNLINEILLKKTFPEYNLQFMSDASDALDYIRGHRNNLPPIMVLDLNMPIVSGWEILEELKQQNHRGRVFLLTSSIFKEDQARAKSYSFVADYFIKPLNLQMTEEMRAKIEKPSN